LPKVCQNCENEAKWYFDINVLDRMKDNSDSKMPTVTGTYIYLCEIFLYDFNKMIKTNDTLVDL